MSDFTNIPTEAAAAVVSLVTDLLAANVTHGIEQAVNLPDEEFPHLMVHSWSADNALLDHLQVEVTYNATLDVWFRTKTQDEARVEMDAIINGWFANRTLNGTVTNSVITSISLFEHPDRVEKVIRIELSAFVTENL